MSAGGGAFCVGSTGSVASAMPGYCVCILVRDLVSGSPGLAVLSSRLDRGVGAGLYVGSRRSEREVFVAGETDSGVLGNWFGGVRGSNPSSIGASLCSGKERTCTSFSTSSFKCFVGFLRGFRFCLDFQETKL